MRRFFALLFSHLILFSLCINYSYAQNDEFFVNPILAGFYPDPSICKVGKDYFLVNSTFSFFPGLPVFQSNDLVNWKLIGHVLDRPEQLNLDSQGVSRGLFAPAIRYHNGLFYVTCTLVDIGGNFVVTSKTAAGPWSNPIWLPEINGIDPSFFFDDDEKAYILYNSDAPDNKPLYSGHRTIRMVEFDIENMKVKSKPKILVNGGVDITKRPVWIEGPHIYKVNETYYLTAAEGGTAEDHSQVIFKSNHVDGPYIPYDKNPILTQKDLNPNRKNPVTCTGHADFVQTENGDWWAVFLGCRPFEVNNYNTGRETFLAPVSWIDVPEGPGWPIINSEYLAVQFSYPLPVIPTAEKADISYSGNFTIKDEFDKQELHPSWIFLRTPHEKWYDLKSKSGYLTINLRPETCSRKMNPSFIARRQQHAKGSVITSLTFNPTAENEKAGLVVFLNETHFYFLCKSIVNGEPVIQLFKSSDNTDSENEMELIASSKIDERGIEQPLNLKIEADKNVYSFYYSYEDTDWILLKDNLDAAFLSIRIPRDFTGCVYAMYATSLGKPTNNIASYDCFKYSGNDEVYNELLKGN